MDSPPPSLKRKNRILIAATPVHIVRLQSTDGKVGGLGAPGVEIELARLRFFFSSHGACDAARLSDDAGLWVRATDVVVVCARR